MSEMMEFPETWEEYKRMYSFCDREEVYTNGSELMSILRIEQWLEHVENKRKYKQQAIKARDCINRQDAIVNMASAIWHYPNELYTSLNCFDNCQELAERALNSLPSASTELSNNSPKLDNENGDLISRQDAINTSLEFFVEYLGGAFDENSQKELMVRLQRLPSAEPDVIRCKDCKYWDMTWQNDFAPNYHYCPLVDGTRRGDFYCADAERRTDE